MGFPGIFSKEGEGTRTQGYDQIDHLRGDPRYKARLKAFLPTLTGECTFAQACDKLDMCQSRFFDLRHILLQRSLDLLAPKPTETPPQADR